MSHYQQRLEQDLTRIRQQVEAMAQAVETALNNAVGCVLRGDESLGSQTVLGDNPINRSSREIDRLCHAFIARHLPSAGHLRLMSSVIRVNVALERIGDYAVTISREGMQLKQPPSGPLAKAVATLGEEAKRLLRLAIDAFDQGNEDRAREVLPMADRVEDMMDDIYADLFEAADPSDPRAIVAPFVIFSLLKRVTDQAKNICEQTMFSVLGKTKKPKVSHILFLDQQGTRLAPLAQALANKAYPAYGRFSAAGNQASPQVDPALLIFLDQRGIDHAGLSIQPLSALQHDLSDFDVVVSLQGQVKDYLPRLPFHTSPLSWDLTSDSDDLDGLYRLLHDRIEALMTILTGVQPHEN